MVNMADVYVGDIVSFIYNGGSEPGEVRLVYVQDIERSGINTKMTCFDFNKQAVRTFLYRKIVDINIVDETRIKTTELADLPSAVTCGDMVNGYARDGYLTYITNDAIIAVLPRADNDMPMETKCNRIYLNEYISLYGGYDGVSLYVKGIRHDNATLNMLVEALKNEGVI